jgi:flagellar biosynthesis/type III secretory pathway chaperone
VDEARKLWQSGEHREALSLLYRGALVRLINQEKVKLQNSHTEGDVLRFSAKKLDEKKQSYLKYLTTQWQLIAYAHRSPSDTDMQMIFERWSNDFDVDTLDQGGSDE